MEKDMINSVNSVQGWGKNLFEVACMRKADYTEIKNGKRREK